MDALARWGVLVAYVNDRPIMGMPGVRDPEYPCEGFSPGEPERHGWGACETDGHYMCDECTERASCDCGCGNRPSQCACLDCGLSGTCVEMT